MTHPNNADPLNPALVTSPLTPVLASLLSRIEMHTIIIRQNPKPHMKEFDRGQLYAIEKVLEFLYEELSEGSL